MSRLLKIGILCIIPILSGCGEEDIKEINHALG